MLSQFHYSLTIPPIKVSDIFYITIKFLSCSISLIKRVKLQHPVSQSIKINDPILMNLCELLILVVWPV